MANLILLTGNILESSAEALVNTVNCEGYMGKGLAYQFKKRFPETNKAYIEACKKKELQPGRLHTFKEDGKIIINFPTKNKWREKSKIIYIEEGMKALNNFVLETDIKSIAIPPLGSGNGGLKWEEVKQIILKYAYPLSKNVDIKIYEPSLSYKAKIKQPPKLTLSHLILMHMKNKLTRFSKFRLQKTAFFFNLFLHNDFFKFNANHYGPYSYPIEIISKEIKEFQDYHKFSTDEALKYAYNTLISKNVEKKLNSFIEPLNLASNFINSIASNEKIELYSSILYAIKNQNYSEDEIVEYIHNWSNLKKEKFSYQKIANALKDLQNNKIIEQDILGNYLLSVSINV